MRLVLLLFLWAMYSFVASGNDNLDFIEENNLLGKRVELHGDEWGVNPLKIDQGNFTYKGQYKDLIQWENLDPHRWLSIHDWINERAAKDKVQGWKRKLRDSLYQENIARVLRCVGLCQRASGSGKNIVEYGSILKEGDEFYTDYDSYAWLFLKDGSLIRVSPRTSITFREINISRSTVFYYVRLNHGHIKFQSRKIGQFKAENRIETDTAFYPLKVKEANREYYSMLEYRKMDGMERLMYSAVENAGYNTQYEKLNEYLLEQRKKISKYDTKIYFHTPSMSLVGMNTNFDLFYAFNGKTKFVSINDIPGLTSSDERKSSIHLELRGYTNTEKISIEDGAFYEVGRGGIEYLKQDEPDAVMKTISSFTKRIPGIHLAREIMLRKFSSFLFEEDLTFKKMAKKVGYRLWDVLAENEMSQRFEFISKFTRRVETTMLKSMKKVIKQKKNVKLDTSFYRRAMEMHYSSIRNQYSEEKKILRELTDSQYYLWILKYGKK